VTAVRRGPEPEAAEVAALAAARASVLARIDGACIRAGRDPRDVTLVAVTKSVPPDRLRAAVAAGLDLLAENRVQEAAAKVPNVPGARWHLVGPLQANKVRRAVGLFDVIETVDSLELARRLDRVVADLRSTAVLPVLLQVNVDEDPAKAGFRVPDLESSLAGLLRLEHLRIEGLMTIGRAVGTPELARATFAALRRLSTALRGAFPALGSALSMGMSADFEVAIEEGATLVRVGTALFGTRPEPPRSA
jgi:pyridoxal phosphate enzyme (YggS family)